MQLLSLKPFFVIEAGPWFCFQLCEFGIPKHFSIVLLGRFKVNNYFYIFVFILLLVSIEFKTTGNKRVRNYFNSFIFEKGNTRIVDHIVVNV